MTLKIKNPVLLATVFICGSSTMIYELVGSRLLAPFLWNSIFVWTSLIGAILASLSVGYILWGKLADKKSDMKTLAFIVFLSGMFVLFSVLGIDIIYNTLQEFKLSPEFTSLLLSLIIFSPASLFFGMISPYAIKLQLNTLDETGKTAGNLMALSTIGSILGTFAAGYFIIPFFGSTETIIGLSVLLFVLSLLLYSSEHRGLRILFIILALLFWSLFLYTKNDNFVRAGILDIDSTYNRIHIAPGTDYQTGKKVLNLSTDPFGTQSSMFLESDDLVLEYTKFFDLALHFNPESKKTLLIWGCVYSYPKYFLKNYSNSTIDVVEIDPEMTRLAQEYFRLKLDPRLRIHHEDGRIFLNESEKKFDTILVDAFNSMSSIPHHLTTQEIIKKQFDHLNTNGVVITNVISAIEGKDWDFFRALYSTYVSVFPRVLVFQVYGNTDGNLLQNLVIVALKNPEKPNLDSNNLQTKKQLANLWKKPIQPYSPILTDNFAPAEYLQHRSLD